jgi:DNA-binding NarL/FixJ family response regulator
MAEVHSGQDTASTLKAQGAALDAAARTVPGERHLKPVRNEGASEPKTLGLVWVLSSYPLVAAGLEKILEGKADVRIGVNSFAGSPSCVVLYADGMEEGFVDGMRRIHELYPGVPLLAFGPRLDLTLALATLKNRAAGFVHAAMECEQVLKAVEVVQKGELAAPRQLLPHLLSQNETSEVRDLTVRQREVL